MVDLSYTNKDGLNPADGFTNIFDYHKDAASGAQGYAHGGYPEITGETSPYVDKSYKTGDDTDFFHNGNTFDIITGGGGSITYSATLQPVVFTGIDDNGIKTVSASSVKVSGSFSDFDYNQNLTVTYNNEAYELQTQDDVFGDENNPVYYRCAGNPGVLFLRTEAGNEISEEQRLTLTEEGAPFVLYQKLSGDITPHWGYADDVDYVPNEEEPGTADIPFEYEPSYGEYAGIWTIAQEKVWESYDNNLSEIITAADDMLNYKIKLSCNGTEYNLPIQKNVYDQYWVGQEDTGVETEPATAYANWTYPFKIWFNINSVESVAAYVAVRQSEDVLLSNVAIVDSGNNVKMTLGNFSQIAENGYIYYSNSLEPESGKLGAAFLSADTPQSVSINYGYGSPCVLSFTSSYASAADPKCYFPLESTELVIGKLGGIEDGKAQAFAVNGTKYEAVWTESSGAYSLVASGCASVEEAPAYVTIQNSSSAKSVEIGSYIDLTNTDEINIY